MNFWFKPFLLGVVGCSCLISLAQAETQNLAAISEANLIEAQRMALAVEKKKVFEKKKIFETKKIFEKEEVNIKKKKIFKLK